MLLQKINTDIKQAMINKEADKLSVLRMLLSAINNEAINLKKKEEGLNEQEEIAILKREVKKRKDSIQQFESAGRNDLVANESKELEILKVYLPEEMSEDEVKKVVTKVIADMGEVTPSQFGQVMSKVMAELKGQADGGLVNQIVKQEINK